MTYKPTRSYDIKLHDRLIDFDSLVDNAISALTDFATQNQIDGYVGCNLDLVYPDLNLLEDNNNGWNHRIENLTDKIHRQFSDVDWAVTNLRSSIFNVLDFAHSTLPHRITTAVRKGQNQLLRSIEVSIPCRESFLPTLIVLRFLLKMITPDWFRDAESANLTTWATIPPNPNDVIVHQELGKRVPWKHWLHEDNRAEVIQYFRTPGVAESIVEECKGFYMMADKAHRGEKNVQRYLYDEGSKKHLSIDTPADVVNLVVEKGFYAFYSSCETLNGDVGKVCIDIDARWMLQSLLGPETTWSLQCALVDAILELGTHLQWPNPAIKFSGSRGVQVYWLVEKGAVGSDWIDIEPYRETAFNIDRRIIKKKTTESFLHPFIGLKTLIQAMVLRAKQNHMDWSFVPISDQTLQALGIETPEQVITIGALEDQFNTKLGVDVISRPKGVFRTALSPHFKSDLVSRNIRNQFGQIGSEYRVWRYMSRLAERQQVREDLLQDHRIMRPNPGTLNRKHLELLAERVVNDVSMLLKFSAAVVSDLTPETYQHYESLYAKRKVRKPWRPWNANEIPRTQSNG
ncbi:MAG: hypothetical protein ACXAAO_03985 [Candidatus Thorarchaeota archaeon]|jgi:hypothetical protein